MIIDMCSQIAAAIMEFEKGCSNDGHLCECKAAAADVCRKYPTIRPSYCRVQAAPEQCPECVRAFVAHLRTILTEEIARQHTAGKISTNQAREMLGLRPLDDSPSLCVVHGPLCRCR